MAIARIKKVRILSYQENKERLLSFLQNQGTVQIISTKEPDFLENILVDTSYLKEDLKSIKEILDFLKPYIEFKTELFLTEEEFNLLVRGFDFKGFISQIKKIKEEFRDLENRKQALLKEKEALAVWGCLDLELGQLLPTRYTETILGYLPRKRYAKFLNEIGSFKLYVKEACEDRSNRYILIVCLIEEKEKLFSLLERFNFVFISLPYRKVKVRDILKEIQEEMLIIEERFITLKNELVTLAKATPKLMATYDYLLNLRQRQQIQENLKVTKTTFIVTGWIQEKNIPSLKKALDFNFKDSMLFINDPSIYEVVPVALENKRLFRPFEVVTEVFGVPRYGWIDPTAYLTIFFILSLGLCLTDAGYGIILALGAYLGLKRWHGSTTIKKLLQLFLICGLFTVFTGAIFGSWFGNLLDKNMWVKSIKDKVIIFDPLKQPLNFLFLSLGFGFLQILFGLFLRFIKELKEGIYFEALFRELPSILIQLALPLGLLIMFGFISKGLLWIVLAWLGLGAFLISLYQFKTQKGFALRLFWIIYGLYGIIAGNFLADTLSFCRIFALGLTTSLLATAINEIYFMLPFFLRAVLIPGFILVHLLNLAINLLGAYVHTCRLQYLEFFTKFFEGQQEVFKPFKKEFEFVRLKGG
ncbi:MAG: V-type ATP synthase subunit I [Candidatus Omnitrophica bacterium]|nr:V-type ATP synthase subunit I [Candidatus Omnitrophota bacterium]